MKPNRLLPWTVLVAAFFVSSCGSAPQPAAVEPPTPWSELAEFVRADMARHGIPGLAIAVSTSKGTLWSAGWGRAAPGTDLAFTPSIVSNEGSVSKLVTATAVMQLVEQGKIDLDAPLTRYLPEFSPRSRLIGARPITVRDVMTHHSGLPSDGLQGFLPGSVPPPGYPDSFQRNVATASSLFLTNPPGKAFSYSNLAVSLLGVVVERVSGQSFEDYCQTKVFQPLGMTDSSFLLPAGFDKNPRYARGTSGGRSTPIPYLRDLPAGGLNSTALDLARFTASYLAAYRGDPGVLSQAAVRQMFAAQNKGVEADAGFQIGLNFWLVDSDLLPGEFLVGHGGDLDSFHALVLLLPDRDLAVNIQVNGVDGFGSFTLIDIAARALRVAAAVTGQAPLPAAAAPAAPALLPAAEIERLTGTYASALGVVRVRPQGRGFQVSLMGNWLEGLPRADGRIGVEARVLGLKLPIDLLDTLALEAISVDDKPALALLVGGMAYGPAIRVEPRPLVAAWKARLGGYRVVGPTPGDIADEAKLSVDGETGLLMFGVRAMGQWVSLPINTLSDAEAVTIGYGRNLGETLAAEGRELRFGGLTFERR